MWHTLAKRWQSRNWVGTVQRRQKKEVFEEVAKVGLPHAIKVLTKEEVTCCFHGIQSPTGSVSLPLSYYIFHIKIHKCFVICVWGRGRARVLCIIVLSTELAGKEGDRHKKPYRAWLIEQHLVRVHEMLLPRRHLTTL